MCILPYLNDQQCWRREQQKQFFFQLEKRFETQSALFGDILYFNADGDVGNDGKSKAAAALSVGRRLGNGLAAASFDVGRKESKEM